MTDQFHSTTLAGEGDKTALLNEHGVDVVRAGHRAREIADQAVRDCFPPHQRDSGEANYKWFKTYSREYRRMTQP